MMYPRNLGFSNEDTKYCLLDNDRAHRICIPVWRRRRRRTAPQVIEDMTKLGYPGYVAVILGVWKVLGGVAVLIPRFPRLKEWAYAGMVFDLTGAAASHAAGGDPAGKIATPLIILCIVMASWALRPESRALRDPPGNPIGLFPPTLPEAQASRPAREPNVSRIAHTSGCTNVRVALFDNCSRSREVNPQRMRGRSGLIAQGPSSGSPGGVILHETLAYPSR